MRIWLVNPFEALPDEGFPRLRYQALALELAQRGHDVTWWSTDFSHFSKSYRPTISQVGSGVALRAIHAPAYRSNTSPGRVFSHAALALATARAMAAEVSRPDVVLLSAPPLEQAAVVAGLCRARGWTLCVDVLDVWPDSFEQLLPRRLQPAAPLLLWPHRQLLRFALRSVDALIAVSQTYLQWARERAGSVHHEEVFPWAFAQPDPVVLPRALDHPLVATFCGTLGVTYDFDIIFEAARLLEVQAPGAFSWQIIGDGPRRAELEARAKAESVQLLGPLKGASLDAAMRASHVGLCSYERSAPQSLPIKLYQYLAYGLPVIETLGGEMGALVADHGMGVTKRDASEVAATLLRWAQTPAEWQGLAARALEYAAQYHLERESERFADLLEGLAQLRPT